MLTEKKVLHLLHGIEGQCERAAWLRRVEVCNGCVFLHVDTRALPPHVLRGRLLRARAVLRTAMGCERVVVRTDGGGRE